VRHLSKELGIDISQIDGTGKDGRVMKEDLQRHGSATASEPTSSTLPIGEDTAIPLTGIRQQMFKTMTKSLTIPHFLFSDTIDFTSLTALRRTLNTLPDSSTKFSPLPFIVKAVSLAFSSSPSLNAHLDTSGPSPVLTHKAAHHFGIAIDTPHGLVVPVIRNVQSRSIADLATELSRLSSLARENKLAPADFSGATFTISNIGSIGGGTVAPVIVGPQVGILGIGRARAVPGFAEDGTVVRKEEAVFSWSADHRVVDGAEVARIGDRVRRYLERVETMVVAMR
jgi:2-oxoisovalerate dehydrogenase E2 component (dihydrolipoyl transacylase)